MRIAVYTDYVYRQERGRVYAPRAFATFVAGLARSFDRLVLVGRLDPEPGRSHYPLPDEVEFVALPHYASLARPGGVARALLGSLRRFDRVLREVDAVWILGPQGLALGFAALAAGRRRGLTLGVRQDLPRYVRSRHPARRWMHLAADTLEGAFRLLALRVPVVVVGPDLARRYRRGSRVLAISVSLVSERDIAPSGSERSWEGESLRALSVGRLETEKNPLLLAEALARVRERDPRWRLVVCGEGPLRGELEARARELGVADAVELLGYVPIDGGLLDVYREAHAFLHVSWTEGLPQVLYEAFAARTPVVATAVGGVADAAGDAALLMPPGDPDAAAERLARLAADPALRARLVRAGVARVSAHTVEAEGARVTAFLHGRPVASPVPA
jgi:glycosyltransferase involved in cell wall biosynthesis